MQIISKSRSGRGPLRRAATMIEFALVIPVFLFMMLFSVDMGLLMLTSGAMNDTAFSAARAGAQVGGGGWSSEQGQYLCRASGPCGDSDATDVVSEGVAALPLSDAVYTFDLSDTRIESGAVCSQRGDDTFVTVAMPYNFKFFTPGLSQLIGLTGAPQDPAGVSLTATGVARCEIYR